MPQSNVNGDFEHWLEEEKDRNLRSFTRWKRQQSVRWPQKRMAGFGNLLTSER
jgi:hypothetical protein